MNNRGSYWRNLAIGIDQGIGTLFGIPADLTISGYVGYKCIESGGKLPWSMLQAGIDWIFGEKHCRNSVEWDLIVRYYGDKAP